MINKVFLIGRLGKDPDVKYTPDNKMVVNFNLATDESYKDKSGGKVSRVEWHKIVVWEKLAEICANYLEKGSLIYLEGKIQTRQWEDKEGVKKFTTEIICKDMKMLDGKKKEEKDVNPETEKAPLTDVPF